MNFHAISPLHKKITFTNQRLLWIPYEVLTRPINPNNVQAALLSKESLVPIKLIDGYLIILNSLLSIKLHMYVTKSIHTHTHSHQNHNNYLSAVPQNQLY